MPKKNLEQTVAAAAREFALQIVDAVKAATLQELADLSGAASEAAPRSERIPAATGEKKTRKRRKRRNYPKCAVPGCDNNRFVRGKGFCGVHWKEHQAGKIGAADTFSSASGEKSLPKTVIKRAGKKKAKAAPAKAAKTKAPKAKAPKAKAPKAKKRIAKKSVAKKK